MSKAEFWMQLLRTIGVKLLVILTGVSVMSSNKASAPAPASPPAVAPITPPQCPMPEDSQPFRTDPSGATAVFRVKGGQCTCTILAVRSASGRYLVLSAAHCVRGGIRTATVILKDGRQYAARVLRVDTKADLCLSSIAAPDGLPSAEVADSEPGPGTPVWVQGYGVEAPGQRRDGLVVGGPGSDGKLTFRLSVSPGDSGGGIFRADNGRLVGVVCCKSATACYGGGVTAIRRLIGKLALEEHEEEYALAS